MAKIDYERYTLPDIEMYAGNTDVWEFALYDFKGIRMKCEDAVLFEYQLVIKDYGYTHRQNGATYFSLTKPGEVVIDDEDEFANAQFVFAKEDTVDRFGKFTYQIEAFADGNYYTAQGNLYILKNINQ